MGSPFLFLYLHDYKLHRICLNISQSLGFLQLLTTYLFLRSVNLSSAYVTNTFTAGGRASKEWAAIPRVIKDDGIKWVLIVCGIYMTGLCVFSQTIPEVFARLFLQDKTLIPLASECIRKYSVGLFILAVQYSFL